MQKLNLKHVSHIDSMTRYMQLSVYFLIMDFRFGFVAKKSDDFLGAWANDYWFLLVCSSLLSCLMFNWTPYQLAFIYTPR